MHFKCTLFNLQRVKQLLDHCRLFFPHDLNDWSLVIGFIAVRSKNRTDPRTSLGLSSCPIHFYELDVFLCKSPYFISAHGVIQIKLILVSSNPSEFSGRILNDYESYSMTHAIWFISMTDLILEFCDRSKQSNVYQSLKLYSCVSSMPSKMWWQFW